MIYVSVDNDHHGGLAMSLIKKHGLSVENVTFISHISRRNNTIPNSAFTTQVIAGHPLSSGSGYKNLLTYIRSVSHQKLLNKIFQFEKNDILVIITEYQLNNALLACKMKRVGGQVYLFDEGIGFYFNNSPFHDTHTSTLDKIFLLLYNLAFGVLGIPAYARKGFEGRMYVCIKDVFIDRIYSRMRLPINRPGDIHGYRNLLASEEALKNKNENLAIFFASNLSCFGLKDEELAISDNAVRQMAATFEAVYIKIHPADCIEQNDIFWFYKNLINLHANIHLIDNSMTGNEAIEHIRPRVVVGAMGATMFDAFFFGCQPIFLFQFLPAIKQFEVCRCTLKNIGYRYINGLEEICPDYRCDVDISSLLYEEESSWWQQSSINAELAKDCQPADKKSIS